MIYLILHIYKDVNQRCYFLECICSLPSKERERKKKKKWGMKRRKKILLTIGVWFLEK